LWWRFLLGLLLSPGVWGRWAVPAVPTEATGQGHHQKQEDNCTHNQTDDQWNIGLVLFACLASGSFPIGLTFTDGSCWVGLVTGTAVQTIYLAGITHMDTVGMGTTIASFTNTLISFGKVAVGFASPAIIVCHLTVMCI